MIVVDEINNRICSAGVCHGVQIDATGRRVPFTPGIKIICFPGTKNKIDLVGIDLKGFEVKIEERPPVHAL